MRHRKSGVKLNRTSSHRNAMFRNMVTSLFKYDRIQTTDTKAKELRKWADNIITLAKRGDLHARRQVLSIIREKSVVHKLFEGANERYGERAGGYTRISKIGRRAGDASPVSMIELIFEGASEQKKKSEKAKKSTKETKPVPAESRKEAALPEDKPENKELSASTPAEPEISESPDEVAQSSEEEKTEKKE